MYGFCFHVHNISRRPSSNTRQLLHVYASLMAIRRNANDQLVGGAGGAGFLSMAATRATVECSVMTVVSMVWDACRSERYARWRGWWGLFTWADSEVLHGGGGVGFLYSRCWHCRLRGGSATCCLGVTSGPILLICPSNPVLGPLAPPRMLRVQSRVHSAPPTIEGSPPSVMAFHCSVVQTLHAFNEALFQEEFICQTSFF